MVEYVACQVVRHKDRDFRDVVTIFKSKTTTHQNLKRLIFGVLVCKESKDSDF